MKSKKTGKTSVISKTKKNAELLSSKRTKKNMKGGVPGFGMLQRGISSIGSISNKIIKNSKLLSQSTRLSYQIDDYISNINEYNTQLSLYYLKFINTYKTDIFTNSTSLVQSAFDRQIGTTLLTVSDYSGEDKKNNEIRKKLYRQIFGYSDGSKKANNVLDLSCGFSIETDIQRIRKYIRGYMKKGDIPDNLNCAVFHIRQFQTLLNYKLQQYTKTAENIQKKLKIQLNLIKSLDNSKTIITAQINTLQDKDKKKRLQQILLNLEDSKKKYNNMNNKIIGFMTKIKEFTTYKKQMDIELHKELGFYKIEGFTGDDKSNVGTTKIGRIGISLKHYLFGDKKRLVDDQTITQVINNLDTRFNQSINTWTYYFKQLYSGFYNSNSVILNKSDLINELTRSYNIFNTQQSQYRQQSLNYTTLDDDLFKIALEFVVEDAKEFVRYDLGSLTIAGDSQTELVDVKDDDYNIYKKGEKSLVLGFGTELKVTGKKLYKVPPFLTRHISKTIQNVNIQNLDNNIIADAILYNDYITSDSDIIPGVFLHTITLLKNLNNNISNILNNIGGKAKQKFKYEENLSSSGKYKEYIEIRRRIYKTICYCQLWLYVMFLHQQSNYAYNLIINNNDITVKDRILDKIDEITKVDTNYTNLRNKLGLLDNVNIQTIPLPPPPIAGPNVGQPGQLGFSKPLFGFTPQQQQPSNIYIPPRANFNPGYDELPQQQHQHQQQYPIDMPKNAPLSGTVPTYTTPHSVSEGKFAPIPESTYATFGQKISNNTGYFTPTEGQYDEISNIVQDQRYPTVGTAEPAVAATKQNPPPSTAGGGSRKNNNKTVHKHRYNKKSRKQTKKQTRKSSKKSAKKSK
jgi:hypothetical protein